MRTEFITLETLLEKRENDDDFTLIEVLGRDQYESGHIPGAVSLPVNEIEERAEDELDKGEDIVLYCASYVCQASVKADEKFHNLGFTKVVDFKGGKARWKEAGLDLETGSGERQHHQKAEAAAKEHEDTCEFC